MGFADRIEASDVKDPRSLANYVQQTVGCPYPTGKEVAAFNRRLKETLKNNPQLTYPSLCRVAQWARAKKVRLRSAASLFTCIGSAYKDGYLPELDPANQIDHDLETRILEALEVEKDPVWRSQLFGTEGHRARAELLARWQQHRGVLV